MMLREICVGCLMVLGGDLFPQPCDSAVSKPTEDKLPGLMRGGFFDLAQNGQINASARIITFYLGDPERFNLPVSVYSGISANNFSLNQRNEDLVLNLANPNTGIINLGTDGKVSLLGRSSSTSRLMMQYQASIRYLSIYNAFILRNVSFVASSFSTGLTLLTGAWIRSSEPGFFWLRGNLIYSHSPNYPLRLLMMDSVSRNTLALGVGLGLEIRDQLNLKLHRFNFLNNLGHEDFSYPFVQVSLSYGIRN